MRHLVVDPARPDPHALEQAVTILRSGGTVAYPTDTLYGLAVDPRSALAVRRLFALKGRSEGRAIPLVAADLTQVEKDVGHLSALSVRLAERFWPGPLSLIVSAHDTIAERVTDSLRQVAVRVPDCLVARELARLALHPLTATSANLSGHPASASPDEVAAQFESRLDGLLDAGPAPGGLPSTIVDASKDEPLLIRAGALPWARVIESL
jgi:L-threonylcarbamoyladenylate synthase